MSKMTTNWHCPYCGKIASSGHQCAASPKVGRQGKLFIPADETCVPCAEKPTRVWTVTSEPELPMVPTHGHGAFLEDEKHDWKWHPLTGLSYFSRLRDKKSGTWLLLEFDGVEA